MIKRVAVVKWFEEDAITNSICDELARLDIEPVIFPYYGSIPEKVDMVLTFAPYEKLLPIACQMAKLDPQKRPLFVHWNTENPPDPHIPWMLTKQIAWVRSWIDRLAASPRPQERFFASLKPLSWIRAHMYRFRYVGDYRYAYFHGLLDILVEASKVFAQQDIAHGIPAVFIPWGTSPAWHANLHLKRDIDVLWFGKRRTKRRSDLIERVRNELQEHGVNMMVVDGVERPFIFGEERTQILNRTKITISILTHPYEYVCPFRFHMAAGNRVLVISEPELEHHPACIPGTHIVMAQEDQFVEKILYYLSHEEERNQITENAYQLVTRDLTLANSLKAILCLAENTAVQSKHCRNRANPKPKKIKMPGS